jgi:hypothetical protein
VERFNHQIQWSKYFLYIYIETIKTKTMLKRITIILMFLVTNVGYAYSQSYLITDIRLVLMDTQSKSLQSSRLKHIYKNPDFVARVHESIRDPLKIKLDNENVLIDLNSMVYIEGLVSKSYNYKNKNVEEGDYLISIESTVGLAEVTKHEIYEIVTIIKIMDYKKRRVYKGKTFVELQTPEEVNRNQINSKDFVKAYIRSLRKVIDPIGKLDR